MTTTTDPREKFESPMVMSQTDNPRDAFHAIYTDSELMAWWLAQPTTLRDKMERALRCSEVAADPRFRFGLESVPEDVRRVIAAFLAECQKRAELVRAEIEALRSFGQAWDTVWRSIDRETGFGPGDAAMLGVS